MASGDDGGGLIQFVILGIIGTFVWVVQSNAKKKRDAEAQAQARFAAGVEGVRETRRRASPAAGGTSFDMPEQPAAAPVAVAAPTFEAASVERPEVVLETTRTVTISELVPKTPSEYRDAVIWREVFAPCPGMRA